MKGIVRQQYQTVSKVGAAAGAVLGGSSPINNGLRLRVEEAQAAGLGGPITGAFVILEAGDNKHSGVLLALVGERVDAKEVTAAIRRGSRGCVSAINSNILIPE